MIGGNMSKVWIIIELNRNQEITIRKVFSNEESAKIFSRLNEGCWIQEWDVENDN